MPPWIRLCMRMPMQNSQFLLAKYYFELSPKKLGCAGEDVLEMCSECKLLPVHGRPQIDTWWPQEETSSDTENCERNIYEGTGEWTRGFLEEVRSGVPWELQYAVDLVVMAPIRDEQRRKLVEWRASLLVRGLKVKFAARVHI